MNNKKIELSKYNYYVLISLTLIFFTLFIVFLSLYLVNKNNKCNCQNKCNVENSKLNDCVPYASFKENDNEPNYDLINNNNNDYDLNYLKPNNLSNNN
jgi:hypothetical protein